MYILYRRQTYIYIYIIYIICRPPREGKKEGKRARCFLVVRGVSPQLISYSPSIHTSPATRPRPRRLWGGDVIYIRSIDILPEARNPFSTLSFFDKPDNNIRVSTYLYIYILVYMCIYKCILQRCSIIERRDPPRIIELWRMGTTAGDCDCGVGGGVRWARTAVGGWGRWTKKKNRK